MGDDEIDLYELWDVLVRRKWTVFGTLIVLPAGTMIVTMMTPSYRISATLKVEEFTENKGVPINVTVAELMKYLKSHSLARQVIKQLNLQDSFDAKNNKGALSGVIASIKNLYTKEKPEVSLEELFLKKLTISSIKKAKLVQAQYENADPVETAMITNTLATSAVNYYQSSNYDNLAIDTDRLEKRVKDASMELDEAESAFFDFEQKHGTFDLSSEIGILTSTLKVMKIALINLRIGPYEGGSRYQEMLSSSEVSYVSVARKF